MKMLVFPFGRDSYVSKSQSWGASVATEIKQVEELMKHSQFAYLACGDQEVYKVSEEGLALYEELKPKLKAWIMSQDKEQYRMSREVTAW